MVKLKKIVKQIEKAANKKSKKKKKSKIKTKNILSSGSTLLNLACTNNPYGAFMKGKYYHLVGDTDSGKTFLSMTCFAEAVCNPEFANYQLIYDNVEDGMNIDLEKLFNKKVAERVVPPNIDKDGDPVYSELVEEFYYHIDDAIIKAKKDKKPFIYILDSTDGLGSKAEENKFDEHKEAHQKNKDTAGSYGDGKAKKNSEGLRKMKRGLRKTKSILIIISQTRDNLGFGFKKKTSSGGHALKFYAIVQIWSSVIATITKTIKKKKRKIGTKIKIEIEKNHITGEKHKVEMEIYPTYGIDDIGSCVDYLVDENWWDMKGKRIIATGLGPIMDEGVTREKLIQYIEENKLYKKLQKITGRCWKEIRQACGLGRKGRY